MSRWDYDTVFYRVFCITLLAVAFIFTVILTNVFVDIDGLLSRKEKAKTSKLEPIGNDMSELMNVNVLPGDDKSEDVYDDKDYQNSNDLYRSKRALDPPDLLYHIKDPTLKKILSNRLALLLDDLDEDDNLKNNKHNSGNTIKEDKKDNAKLNTPGDVTNGKQLEKHSTPHIIVLKTDEIIKNTCSEDLKELKVSQRSTNEARKMAADSLEKELLHLAMHNIVLQGIIGNMNLDDVYTKVVKLVNDFESDHAKRKDEDFRRLFQGIKGTDNHKKAIELFDGHIKDLEKLSDLESTIRNVNTNKENENTLKKASVKPKGHNNIMIKTIIDITALTNDKSNKESDANFKDKLNGAIKLIYNGKSIKFKRVDEDITTDSSNISNNSSANRTENSGLKKIELIDENYHERDTYAPSQSYYRKTIHDYLKRFPSEDNLEHDKVYSRKRLKRHIKIRIDNDKTTVKPKVATQDDDELFVEIETHFDSKGAKGEKKKKLVRDLIEKIQRAIHSEKAEKKKKRHWHVKKRTQETLGKKNALINKLILPFQTLAHRHMDPLSKSVPLHEDMPLVLDEVAHNHWNRKYETPKFLSKSINSAEMSTVDIDYSKVMRHNGIPQRLQKPLNTDISDEILQNSTIYDLGNIKFLMKDVDGSGFSIGFNQYIDQAPDPETMKIFSGLENVIQTYHQKYDQESGTPDQQQYQQQNTDNYNQNNQNYYQDDGNEYNNYEYQQMDKPKKHIIERRSIKGAHHKPDHHSNEYKMIVSNYHNFLPYDNYQEIYESNKHRKNIKKYHTKQANSVLVVDDKVFEKDLKPGEILSIADLIQRRKRSFNVQKISNVKIRGKISRYLNTKSMATKSFFLNKKRNKRQIDKIRIVARKLPNSNRNSAEDIFVVSDEKVFADRAVVSEVEVPEIEPHVKMHSDHYDIVSPQKDEDSYDFTNQPHQVTEDHYDIVSPYIYEAPQTFDSQNEFSRRARHNNLMSKYPHIFMDEMARSKEEIYPEKSYAYAPTNFKLETTTNVAAPVVTIIDAPVPNAQQIAQLLPKDTNNNYKVTVKIRPKNSTGVSGFKEVHTSINKSYNRNGLVYTSLVNVSQLSKVEKMNRNVSRREFDNAAIVNLKQQQDIVKTLIRRHKSRIDDQLKQLYLEKEKLETMDIENTEIPPNVTPETFIDVAHPTDPKKKLHLTKDEVSKLFNFEETTTFKLDTPATQNILIKPTIITSTTTTENVPQTTDDNVKFKIIETIERNENITNEILKKIDQNTGVLKTFLGKLIAKMDVNYKKQNLEPTEYAEKPVSKRIISNMAKNEVLTAANSDVPFNFEEYQQSLHNTFFSNLAKQSSNHTGIPFVYAYQQPYGTMSNKESPIASVVYHGHIHTNRMTNRDIFNKPDAIAQYNNRKSQYYKSDNTKPEYYKPEKSNPEYYKPENPKPEYYKPEKSNPEYYKPENTKPEYYKPENPKPEYYKPEIRKSDFFKTKNLVEPENKEVLNENEQHINNEIERKKKEIEKEFWNAKPGETVLQNFVVKNSSKFFMDDAGHDFKMYTPLRDVTLNVTNVHK